MEAFEVTKELLARGSDMPVINHHPLPEYSLRNLDYGMTIGITRTEKGRLFACWVGGGDNPKAYFIVNCSDDNGESWSEPVLVIDPHDKSLPCDRCTIVGNLWTDPLGRVWLFFNQTLLHFDGRSSDWYIRCDNPDDEMPLWSAPQYIWHGATLNKPTVLSGGEWLLPISLWARHHISAPFQDCYHELDELRRAAVFASRDQGLTWERRGGAVFPDTRFDEHMTVELSDGQLWMLGRTANGLWESFSGDGGYTWSEAVRARVQSCSARFFLRRLQSGRILLVKHGREAGTAADRREELTAFLSDDDGGTWSKGLVLDERFEVSYPDGVQAPDGTIYVSYDRNRAKDGEILLARIREEDILAGKCVSRDSRLKMLISRPGRLHPYDWA